ncbi:MAG TPA: hypothetical protein VFG47_21250, partial [Geminicoccaceae bacterium]|nr:hypothetical protein [Geminicoccaceae bacterium]
TRQIEPVSNPFPVYPVQSLGELSDIRAATVHTPEVALVHEAVEGYAETFRTGSVSGQRHLVLAAKGDFGTGKTHLMLYARGVLEAKVAEISPLNSPERRD